MDREITLLYSLTQHLEDEDPYLYNSLPKTMQKDEPLARSALKGSKRFIKKLKKRSGDGVEKYGFYDDNGEFCNENYQKHRNLIQNIFIHIPDAFIGTGTEYMESFRMPFQIINEIDSRFYSTAILPNLDKMGDDSAFERFFAWTGIYDLLHPDHIKEEHYIVRTAAERCFRSSLRDDFPIPSLRLEDIPERFNRCRALYSHAGNTRSLLPPDLRTDKDIWLACLRGISLCHNPHGIEDLWDSIPEAIRSDEKFLSECVLQSLYVLKHCWYSSAFEVEETPFKLLLAAIKANGYEDVQLSIWSYATRIFRHLDGTFDRMMRSELDHHEQFLVFAGGIVQSRRGETCRCSALRYIDFFGDNATSTALKQKIASYVGVPTGQYLVDLQQVWKMRCQRTVELPAALLDVDDSGGSDEREVEEQEDESDNISSSSEEEEVDE